MGTREGAVLFDIQEISKNALASGKECIELLVCEIGQGSGPEDLANTSGLPIKYSEDYVVLPPYGIGSPSLNPSPTAQNHGWQWIR